MVDVIREDPLGAGEKGRVAQALCRKAEELQARLELLAAAAGLLLLLLVVF